MVMLLVAVTAGCYALAAIAVHLWFGRRVAARQLVDEYVLLSNGHADKVEWYIRQFHLFSRWMGQEVRVGLLESSSDNAGSEVLEIASRLADHSHGMLVVLSKTQALPEHAVIVDLEQPQDLSKLPF